MNKFDKLYKMIMEEVSWNGSTRSEMAASIIKKMSEQYPSTEYVFIEGSDNWNAPDPWRVANYPDKFIVDKFQTGFSKYGNNTIVIRKEDLPELRELLKKVMSDLEKFYHYDDISIIRVIPETGEIIKDILYKASSDDKVLIIFDRRK